MREQNTAGTMRGVGVNPICAWGRLKLAVDTVPVLEHGLGVSMTITEDGKMLVAIDPSIRPRFWTPFASAIGSTSAVYVESFDELAGTFVVAVTPVEPPDPPADPPEDVTFAIVPLGEGIPVYASVLVLGVSQ